MSSGGANKGRSRAAVRGILGLVQLGIGVAALIWGASTLWHHSSFADSSTLSYEQKLKRIAGACDSRHASQALANLPFDQQKVDWEVEYAATSGNANDLKSATNKVLAFSLWSRAQAVDPVTHACYFRIEMDWMAMVVAGADRLGLGGTVAADVRADAQVWERIIGTR